jgi:hypothetical protein
VRNLTTNRVLQLLEQVDKALRIAEGENVSFYRAPYPTHPAIARLEKGDLWVGRQLTADLRVEVDRLGSVRHLVSPNKLHHFYLQEWKVAYPEQCYGDWSPAASYRID